MFDLPKYYVLLEEPVRDGDAVVERGGESCVQPQEDKAKQSLPIRDTFATARNRSSAFTRRVRRLAFISPEQRFVDQRRVCGVLEIRTDKDSGEIEPRKKS